MKKKSRIGLNIGTSSILLVFVLLCMVTFAALSFVSANADFKLSQSLATRTTRYYTASNTAEGQLSDMADELSGIYENAADLQAYKIQLQEAFVNTPDITFTPGTDDKTCGTLQWQVKFTDTQVLDVMLTLNNPYANEDLFDVSRWKVIQTSAWEGDSSLKLYDGE